MFSFFVFCLLGWCSVQAEIEIVFEDAECSYVNEEYVAPDSCEFEVNDDSEYGSSLSTKFEIIKELPDDFKLCGNINGIEMGEYTVDMGIHIEVAVCDIVDDTNSLAMPVLKAVNISPDNCPPGPGIYGNDAFVLDSQQGLPDSFPIGKYLLNMTLLHDDVMYVSIYIYLTVV